MHPLRALAVAAALLAAQPASAALKLYDLVGDQSTLFPVCGVVLRPGAVSGTALVDDRGDGAPTLVDLDLRVAWSQRIPLEGASPDSGGAVQVDFLRSRLGPAPAQAGSGDTASEITWGALTGWTQTGRVVCESLCSDAFPSCQACILNVGFEGTGLLPPLADTALDSDPWTFSGDMRRFTARAVRIFDVSGFVTMDVDWRGQLRPDYALALQPGRPLDPMGRGVIHVALLGTQLFEAAEIDPRSLALGPAGARPHGGRGGHLRDVDRDGRPDWVAGFRLEELGLALGARQLCASGETRDGAAFEACAPLGTRAACGLGFETALLLAPLAWLRARRRRARG